MLQRKVFGVTGLILFSLGFSQSSRADFINSVGLGLDALGFNVQGQRNPLSGGVDLLINTNFVGNPLDFGAGDLTLQGPLSLQVSAENRILPTLDISFKTALSGAADATPLSYALNYDVGGQGTDITGTVLLDGELSLNAFGFYDLALNYSSRQEVDNQGRFSDANTTNDFDFGPINVSGNIFADALALITDPFFDAAGSENPFESFSGSARLNDALRRAADGSAQSSLLRANNTLSRPSDLGFGVVVPEPSVLALMAVGAMALISRRGRRAR